MPENADELTCKECGEQRDEFSISGVFFIEQCRNVACPSNSERAERERRLAAQHERYLDERAGDSNR